jgi:hypothetical protein
MLAAVAAPLANSRRNPQARTPTLPNAVAEHRGFQVARPTTSYDLPIRKSAIQQVWKPALQ